MKIVAFFRALFGLDAYQRYVEHNAAHHPEKQPLSEAEFFRAEQDRKWNGVRRCC